MCSKVYVKSKSYNVTTPVTVENDRKTVSVNINSDVVFVLFK